MEINKRRRLLDSRLHVLDFKRRLLPARDLYRSPMPPVSHLFDDHPNTSLSTVPALLETSRRDTSRSKRSKLLYGSASRGGSGTNYTDNSLCPFLRAPASPSSLFFTTQPPRSIASSASLSPPCSVRLSYKKNL